MVHASTMTVIHGINKLLEVSPGIILFQSPMFGLYMETKRR